MYVSLWTRGVTGPHPGQVLFLALSGVPLDAYREMKDPHLL